VFDLIDAFSDMPENCHLLLAGKVADHELVPQLETRVADNPRIHLHARRILDEELQVFYNASDVVVFPFKQILTSGSLVLAMSFGKAVVAPHVESLLEILPEDGVKWFDPLDSDSLRNSLLACACATRFSARGGIFNRRHARDWTWASVAQITQSI
jgi:beta-1,4-mannosyltransferase